MRKGKFDKLYSFSLLIMPDHLKNLQLLGLTAKQSKIYLSLLSEISMTTQELVNTTKISRTKIYGDLQILENKNWIYRVEGRPIRYFANAPEEVFRQESEKIFHRLKETEEHLSAQWEEKEKFQTESINIITGEHFLTKKTIDGIDQAKFAIVLTLRFVFPGEIEQIIKKLENRLKTGISIKLVIFQEIYDAFSDEIKSQLKKFHVKIGPVPLRALIIDNEYTLLSFMSSIVGIEKIETIKITYSGFAEMLRNSFNITFEQFISPSN